MSGKFCGHCGYDLTGLEFQGRCPECGGYYDHWSGEGIRGSGPIEKHRRGDWVVRLLQTLGLVILALGCLGLGALSYRSTGSVGAMVLTGVLAVIFLISALVTGLSLRRL